MRQLSECRSAASSVIGVVLLVGMTVIMVSVIALSIFAYGAFELQPAPEAKIVVMEASGDMDKPLYKNVIVLKHKGGDMLIKRNTEIIITGKGYAYTGHDTHPSSVQDIRVTYKDLSGNNYGGEDGNNLGEIVDGTTWDAGETIRLIGYDGKNINNVITNSQNNTVDSKWKLEDRSIVVVTVIDTVTNQIIAVSQATVRKA